MKIVFLEPAQKEMNEAAQFYEKQVEDLGFRFLDEVDNELNMIKKYPTIGRILKYDIRRILLKNFPFGILYHIKRKQIRIIAVMHLSRKPDYWIKRVRPDIR